MSEVVLSSLHPNQSPTTTTNAIVQQARASIAHADASVQAGGSASSRSHHQRDRMPSGLPMANFKQSVPEDRASSVGNTSARDKALTNGRIGQWLTAISNQPARSAESSARDGATACTGKWLDSMANQRGGNTKCSVMGKASSSARRSCASQRPATVSALPSRQMDVQALLPTLQLCKPSSQKDPAVMPPAGGRLPLRVRSVRAYPSAPNQQSVVDQVVFGQDMDFSGEEKFDQGYLSLFSGCAGQASWDGCTCDVAELRFEEFHPSKSSRAIEGISEEVKPRRQGKMLVPDAPAQKSIVDSVVFDRDVDGSGAAQFQVPYLEMFHGSAGKPSHFQSPRGLRRCPVPGSVDEISFPRATTAPMSISPRRRRCRGGRLQKIGAETARVQ